MPSITREDITGLVLAGGRGSRLGGLDKGLLELHGRPLVAYPLAALDPLAGGLLISANRHLREYAAWATVVPDAIQGQPGPLAGILTGFECSQTPWLALAPCDAPLAQTALWRRLVQALEKNEAEAAVAERGGRLEPAFCLLHSGLANGLAARLARGERGLGAWLETVSPVRVDCSDHPAWFLNINTAEDLARATTLFAGPTEETG